MTRTLIALALAVCALGVAPSANMLETLALVENTVGGGEVRMDDTVERTQTSDLQETQ